MRLGKILVAGVVVLMGTGAMATRASAYIICNGEGDCWHSERRASLASLEEGPAFLSSLTVAKKS